MQQPPDPEIVRGEAHQVRSPGILVVQVDGLSRPAFEAAIRAGTAPVLGALVASGELTLRSWTVQVPPTTPASQAGLLHRRNQSVPGFRWFEKSSGRLVIANHPAGAAWIQARVSTGDGLLARDGVSVGNLLTGDAPRSYLTMATVADEPRLPAMVGRLPGFFLDPRNLGHLVVRMGREAVGEFIDAARQRRERQRPRMRRGITSAIERAVTNGALRHFSTALVLAEMHRRAPVIYVDFTGYDAVAHHSGPERREAMAALASIDRSIGYLVRAAHDPARPYALVVLSDHGQTLAWTFRSRFGRTLDAAVAAAAGTDVTVWAETGPIEHGHRYRGVGGRWLARATGGGHVARAAARDIVVCASGNLAHVYLNRVPGRATREAIEATHPGLLSGLLAHPGVGAILVRDRAGGVVLSSSGTRRLSDGWVDGPDPTAPYGPGAAASFVGLDALEHVGDLVLMSPFDAQRNEVICYEDLVGAHGGLGGPQTAAFVLHPRAWPFPDEPPLGAPAMGTVLGDWVQAQARTPSGSARSAE